MPEKLDLKRSFKEYYAAPKKPVIFDPGPVTCLTIAGRGAPGGEDFTARVGALYAMAYTVKMSRRPSGARDYTIGSLEAQWWSESGRCFLELPRDQWCWKLLILTPDFVGQPELARAAAALQKRGRAPAAPDVKLEKLSEGRCVQMLHIGPYESEGGTIATMTAFAKSKGLSPHGLHHEIYLSDPRRVPPEKLKTILRLPVTSR
jgi:hypothetical protein